MSKEKTSYPDWMNNRLKSVDVVTLEQTIAKAVSELVGKELKCSITSIDYSRRHFGATAAKFDVSLDEPNDMIKSITTETASPAANTPQSDEQ